MGGGSGVGSGWAEHIRSRGLPGIRAKVCKIQLEVEQGFPRAVLGSAEDSQLLRKEPPS